MSKKVTLFGVAALVALVTGGYAVAQQGAPQGAEGEAEGSIEVEEAADLSGQQQLQQAEKIRNRGRNISRRIQSMLDEARRENDIIRVTCLNDKLTQVNANLRTLDDRIENLQEAVDAADPNRRNHEYTVVTVLGQKFNVLEQEANQCLGQDIFETGATKVTTEIDPDTPEEDPEQVPEPAPVPVPFIPPPASPAM